MAQTETEIVQGIGSDYGVKYGFSNPDEASDYFFKSGRGISHEVVEAIAEHKTEPAWMRKVLRIDEGGAREDHGARRGRGRSAAAQALLEAAACLLHRSGARRDRARRP